MSGARKLTNTQKQATDIVAVIENYLRDGGVDPQAVKQIRPCDVLGKKDLLYDFKFDGGRTCKLFVYWVVEPGGARQYLWLEVGMGRVTDSTKHEVMRFMLGRCRDFIGNFKFCLAEDDIIALTLRCAADAFTPAYMVEALGHLDPTSARLRRELAEFGVSDINQTVEERVH